MNAVLKDPATRTSLSIEWDRARDNQTAVLRHLGVDVRLSGLDLAFIAAAAQGFKLMIIPSDTHDHPAVQGLVSREDRAWELSGEKSFLNRSGDALSYNLTRRELLVG